MKVEKPVGAVISYEDKSFNFSDDGPYAAIENAPNVEE
jgi:hypothetical protein